jgi:DNA-binding NtrC family response regulator
MMADLRVLIVDDEEEFATTLAERMKNRGLIADVALSGRDGLAAVTNASYDAVVLDLAMPGMDGLETLKRMLAVKPELQVILLTGRGTIEKSVESIRSGSFEFLEKPIKFDTLLSKVSEAKARKRELTEEKTQEMIEEMLRRWGC